MNGLTSIWDFFQNEILGMKWLNGVIGNGLSALGLDTASRWGGSIQFFLYDAMKIGMPCSGTFAASRRSFRPCQSRRNIGCGFWKQPKDG